MICINATLGLHTPNLFPKRAGRDYELTPYLEAIQEFRNDLTVFSGLSHPEVDGGHPTELSYLTAAPHPQSDQFQKHDFARPVRHRKARAGHAVRLAGAGIVAHAACPSRAAACRSRPNERPSRIFKSMFVDGTPAEVNAQVQRLQPGAEHHGHRARRGEGLSKRPRQAGSAEARRILQLRARGRAADGQGAGMGTPPEAEGQCQAARGRGRAMSKWSRACG